MPKEVGSAGEVIGVVEELILKYKDVFHLKNLYVFCKEWAIENGYSGYVGKPEYYLERYYMEKKDNFGREIWWWWQMHRDIGTPGKSYFQYKIHMSAHCLGIQNTEIIHEGKKYKTQVGEVEFKFYGRLVLDPRSEWKKHSILAQVENLFKKRIFKKNIKAHEEELRREVYRYQGAVKRHLELKEFLPVETPFFPKKGVW